MLSALNDRLSDLMAEHAITGQDIMLAGAAAIVIAGALIKAVSGDRLENDRLSKIGWLITLAGLALFAYALATRVNPDAI